MVTVWVLIVIAVLIYLTVLLLSFPAILSWAMYLLMGLLALYFTVSRIHRGDRMQTQRYLSPSLLFVPCVVFWAFSLQGVTSLTSLPAIMSTRSLVIHAIPILQPILHFDFRADSGYALAVAGSSWQGSPTPHKFSIGRLLVVPSYDVLVLVIHYV